VSKNQKLVLISIYVALSITLDFVKSYIPFLNMPSGGSINIALIPIVFGSFHLGFKNGITIGFLWWLITSLLGLNNYFICVPQYIVDYVLPSVIMGFCAIFYRKKNLLEIELGIFLIMLIRTCLLCLSGAIYWPGELASGSSAAWIASCIYNIPYSLASAIMLMIIVPLLIKSLHKYML